MTTKTNTPLPTTAGSVIRARPVSGPWAFRPFPFQIFGLTTEPEWPWVSMSGDDDIVWHEPDYFTEVTVLFDAGACEQLRG